MVKINITEERGLEQSVGSDGLVSEATVRLRAGATAASSPSHTCAWQSHASIGTGNQDISAAEILTGLLVGDPTADANWTLPAASLLVAALPNAAIGDCIEVGVINTATSAQDEKITLLTSEAGITAVGLMIVDSQLVSGIRGSGSALFRIRLTGVASGSEAYTIYRLT
jgi:hypothetical protein